MSNPKSLKHIMTRNLFMFAIIPFFLSSALGIIIHFFYLNYDMEKNQHLILDLTKKNISEVLNKSTLQLEQFSQLLSHDIINHEDITVYIDYLLKFNDVFESVRLVDENGYILHTSSNEHQIIGYDMSYQNYFKQTEDIGKIYWSSTFISPETAEVILAITIKNSDKTMIVGYLSLKEFQRLINDIPMSQAYSLSIVNSYGLYIAHSDFNRVFERQIETNLSNFNGHMQLIHNNDGERLIIHSQKLIEPDFTLIAYTRTKEYYRTVHRLTIISFLAIVALALLVLVFSKLQNSPISAAIHDLTLKTRDISLGHYNISINQYKICDLNTLSDNFKTMSNSLKVAFDHLSDSQAELEMLNSDLLEQNEKIKKSENQISLILNNIYDGFLLMDPDMNVLRINKAVFTLMNVPVVVQYNQRKCYQLITDHDDLCDNCQTYLIKENPTKTTIIREINHKVIEITTIPLLSDQNKLMGIIKTYRDITEKRAIELKLNKAEKLEAIGRLTAGIAHDFNNFLQVILGYSELVLLNLDESDVENKSRLNNVIATSRKAENLVRQLMTFSKVDTIKQTHMNLNSVIDDIRLLLNQILGNNIRLEMQLSPNISNILADKSQIEQILLNLCVNAKDAMNDEGILMIRTFDTNYKQSPYVCLEIQDTGSGIHKEIINKIYDPFFTTKTVNKGTGLGLSTVLGIVESNGGFIDVDTEIGKGTTFKIYIPAI